MNAKFFVPYETAKALKVAGYNEKVNGYYTKGNDDAPCIAYCGFPINNTDQETCSDISAPTYHEVVDWLEGKGVLIDCTCGYDYDTKKEWYRCFVMQRERRLEDKYISKVAPTREEALNAAILAALEVVQ